MEGWRRCAVAICVAFTLQCFGYALLLPPFEGFDETAHFSYVSVLADRYEIPNFHSTPLDASIDAATRGLPRPYASVPPFENNGGLTYARFFAQTEAERRSAANRYWKQWPGSEYQPGAALNWQGQHPPLFYLLMAPPYRMLAGQSLGVQLTVLRLVSTGLACLSVLIWYLTLKRLDDPASRRVWLAGGGVALAFATLGFDLGRLGNDSLAAACLAAIAYALVGVSAGGRLKDHAVLTLGCTCGLLTKAFFVPVTVAAMGYVAWYQIRRQGWRAAWLRLAMMLLVIGVGAGWWFALFAARYGSPLGSGETVLASQVSDQAWRLSPGAFMYELLRGAYGFVITFLWSGSWSWLRRPNWHYAALLPLVVLGLVGTVQSLRVRHGSSCRQLLAIALTVLLPVLAGFALHVLLRVRLTGMGAGTGGHYLFFAWPALGVLLAGFWDWFRGRGRWLGAIALVAATAVEWSGIWLCLELYAGMLEKTATSPFSIGGTLPTVGALQLVFERLDLLCFPRTALALLTASLVVRVMVWVQLASVQSRIFPDGITAKESQPRTAPFPVVSLRSTSTTANG